MQWRQHSCNKFAIQFESNLFNSEIQTRLLSCYCVVLHCTVYTMYRSVQCVIGSCHRIETIFSVRCVWRWRQKTNRIPKRIVSFMVIRTFKVPRKTFLSPKQPTVACLYRPKYMPRDEQHCALEKNCIFVRGFSIRNWLHLDDAGDHERISCVCRTQNDLVIDLSFQYFLNFADKFISPYSRLLSLIHKIMI